MVMIKRILLVGMLLFGCVFHDVFGMQVGGEAKQAAKQVVPQPAADHVDLKNVLIEVKAQLVFAIGFAVQINTQHDDEVPRLAVLDTTVWDLVQQFKIISNVIRTGISEQRDLPVVGKALSMVVRTLHVWANLAMPASSCAEEVKASSESDEKERKAPRGKKVVYDQAEVKEVERFLNGADDALRAITKETIKTLLSLSQKMIMELLLIVRRTATIEENEEMIKFMLDTRRRYEQSFGQILSEVQEELMKQCNEKMSEEVREGILIRAAAEAHKKTLATITPGLKQDYKNFNQLDILVDKNPKYCLGAAATQLAAHDHDDLYELLRLLFDREMCQPRQTGDLYVFMVNMIRYGSNNLIDSSSADVIEKLEDACARDQKLAQQLLEGGIPVTQTAFCNACQESDEMRNFVIAHVKKHDITFRHQTNFFLVSELIENFNFDAVKALLENGFNCHMKFSSENPVTLLGYARGIVSDTDKDYKDENLADKEVLKAFDEQALKIAQIIKLLVEKNVKYVPNRCSDVDKKYYQKISVAASHWMMKQSFLQLDVTQPFSRAVANKLGELMPAHGVAQLAQRVTHELEDWCQRDYAVARRLIENGVQLPEGIWRKLIIDRVL